jgi:hypothetical protein
MKVVESKMVSDCPIYTADSGLGRSALKHYEGPQTQHARRSVALANDDA